MTTHMVISDCQVKPGHNYDYLERIGHYMVAKQPDVVIQIGDFADLPSLSSYDVGRKSFEGRRYHADIAAAREAMGRLLNPLHEYNNRAKRNGKKQYKPRLVLTSGNHEHRIDRVVDGDPKLDGTISAADLGYEGFGWEVHPFLEVCVVDGIAYSHYFTSGSMGRPVTSPTALLTKRHMSAVMGHVQNRGIAYGHRADGKEITAIFSGSSYEHNEDYLGAQGNNYWRGIWMLHEVDDGSFDALQVSLKYLAHKYGT